MARLGSKTVQDYNKSEAANSNNNSEWRNPNSIVRNCLKLGVNEMAVFTFLQDLWDGDQSLYHTVPEPSERYGTIYPKHYCLRNENDDGFIISENCMYCKDNDSDVRKRIQRYAYWVYVYNVYHARQNPRLDKYDDAVAWEPVEIGRRKYFMEPINKPQLLKEMSKTTWEALENMASEMDDMLVGELFRYTHIINNEDRHQYNITESRMRELHTMTNDDLAKIAGEVPDLELVLSGQVREFAFDQYSSASEEAAVTENEDDAYDRVSGDVEDY